MSHPIAPIGGAPAAITPIRSEGRATGPLGIEGAGGAAPASSTENLGAQFSQALSDAHALANNATQAAEKFATGDTSMGIHEVMIASEKANIALRFATTLKNKALEAYRDLMNTQV